MDAFLEGDIIESELDTTPNIEIQLNKYDSNEYFAKKHIPEAALFVSGQFKHNLLQFYKTNLDIPLLIYGLQSCGKTSTIIGLITYVEEYVANGVRTKSMVMNNLCYMKFLDKEYLKLFVYENLYYLNILTLSSAVEIYTYLKYIYKLSRNRSIDGYNKIIIINHIELCNEESQKYIKYILDKNKGNTSYIFITTTLNKINNRIKSFCAKLHFNHLNETEFTNIFTFNYSHIFNNDMMKYLKHYYQIYVNNRYDIGATISQIKYVIYTQDIKKLVKDVENDFKQSLIHCITKKFIKNKLKLSNINDALEIRKFLYTLLSINIDLLLFVKELVKQLLSSKINDKSKSLIIEKAGILSKELTCINKEVLSVESLVYDLIYIIYSGGIE